MYYTKREAGITYKLRADQCDSRKLKTGSYGLEVIGSLHKVFHSRQRFDCHSLNRALSYAELMLARQFPKQGARDKITQCPCIRTRIIKDAKNEINVIRRIFR